GATARLRFAARRGTGRTLSDRVRPETFPGEPLMIDELIARITANVGLDADLARKAVGMMLAFLQKEGPAAEVEALFNALPGAAELAAENGAKGGIGGAVMGMMGGGVMALGSQLM